MNDFTKTVTILFIMWAMPQCSEKSKPPVRKVDAGIALAVQEDVLRFAIERRLYQLEATTISPQPEKPVRAKIQALSASEAIHY